MHAETLLWCRCEGSSIPLADEALVRKRKEELKHAQVSRVMVIMGSQVSRVTVIMCSKVSRVMVIMCSQVRRVMVIMCSQVSRVTVIMCSQVSRFYSHRIGPGEQGHGHHVSL